jgi:hypothetical protein
MDLFQKVLLKNDKFTDELALQAIYPNHKWDTQTPKDAGYWASIKHQRECMDKIAEELSIRPFIHKR